MHRPAAYLGLALLACACGTRADEPAAQLATEPRLQVAWLQRFSSTRDDWINQLVPLADGHFLAVGFLDRDDAAELPTDWRALAAKLDAGGRVLWQREHGAGGGVDAYWGAAEAPGGKIGAGGFTTRIGNGGIDALVAVLDTDGWIVKENGIGGAGYDRFTDIALAANESFALAGFTEVAGTPGHRDVLLVKTNGNGIESWRRTIGGPGSEVALYLEPTADGGFVLSGGVSAGGDGDTDMLVFKVDGTGLEQWRTVIGVAGTNDINHGLAVRDDGRIVVVGYTQSWGARGNDLVAVTLDVNGAILRHEVFGGADDDRAMGVRFDSAGGAWVTGYTKSAGAGGWDAFLARLDADGAFESCLATIGGEGDDQGTTVLPLDDNDLLLGGYSSNLDGGMQDGFVMRLAAPRCTQPEPRFTRRVIFP